MVRNLAQIRCGRPVSRILSRMTIPLGLPLLTGSSCLPGSPGAEATPACAAGSLSGIAPGGACRAADVAARAVRSYRTVSPLPPWIAEQSAKGGLFSVALSLGLPPPGVTRHHCFVESGLSSNVAARGHPAIRTGMRYLTRAVWVNV